jgi:hypothetical protein
MASQPQSDNASARRAERKPFKATVHFRRGERRANVEVLDITHLGARLAGVFLVREGDRFWLKIASLESIEARVAWVEEFQFGCEFDRPLSELILEAILRTA